MNIVLGAGLTGLSVAFHLVKQGKRVIILEKTDRTGGQIRTIEKDGFVFETGPNTGVISNPETAELLRTLHPNCVTQVADPSSSCRLIWKNGKFHALPSGIIGGITTPLFSLQDKLRIIGEPFRRRGNDPNESVGALAVRRLGRSFLDYAVDPFVSGIYAGDPMRLVTRHALPKLYNLEHTYGSFIRGAVTIGLSGFKNARSKGVTKEIFSVRGGLSQLTNSLADAIGRENIILSADSILLERSEDRWRVSFASPSGRFDLNAGRVITTLGAHALSPLLPFAPEVEMNKIARLRYAPVVQISIGIRNIGKRNFRAFGGLVPSCEHQDVLGVLFPSACFNGRAPEGGMLFSLFAGGIKNPHMVELSDREIENLAIQTFHQMLGFPPDVEPDLLHISRHQNAIPQYESDTGERLSAVNTLQNRFRGLTIAGNLRDGISIADRIRQGASLIS
ncbi:MAG: protoporphyrinogen oxidase [Dysgonamonadaceae bacterium]|jgi:oxygen-dependent protoporphyrinogen oxidase|nr:protoporphyrinogen oxidase [Dysgonamonadaceae bacterium]